MTGFVTAINCRGEKQRIPADWLDERSPFAKDFRLPPSQRTGEPSADWTKNDLLAHAARHHIDHLARQAHRYLADLFAARKAVPVTAFQELPAWVVARIHASSEVARLGPVETSYLQLRITDLLRFG